MFVLENLFSLMIKNALDCVAKVDQRAFIKI